MDVGQCLMQAEDRTYTEWQAKVIAERAESAERLERLDEFLRAADSSQPMDWRMTMIALSHSMRTHVALLDIVIRQFK